MDIILYINVIYVTKRKKHISIVTVNKWNEFFNFLKKKINFPGKIFFLYYEILLIHDHPQTVTV